MKEKEKMKFVKRVIDSCITEDQLNNTIEWGMKILSLGDILKKYNHLKVQWLKRSRYIKYNL